MIVLNIYFVLMGCISVVFIFILERQSFLYEFIFLGLGCSYSVLFFLFRKKLFKMVIFNLPPIILGVKDIIEVITSEGNVFILGKDCLTDISSFLLFLVLLPGINIWSYYCYKIEEKRKYSYERITK